MDKQPNDKIAELPDGSRTEERDEENIETGKSYGQIIESINKNKKIMFVIILIGLAFIIGWVVGYNNGFGYGQQIIEQNYANMTCF